MLTRRALIHSDDAPAPAQWQGMHASEEVSYARALATAVLQQAADDLRLYVREQRFSRDAADIYASAYRWLTQTEEYSAWPLVQICDALKLNADAISERVRTTCSKPYVWPKRGQRAAMGENVAKVLRALAAKRAPMTARELMRATGVEQSQITVILSQHIKRHCCLYPLRHERPPRYSLQEGWVPCVDKD